MPMRSRLSMRGVPGNAACLEKGGVLNMRNRGAKENIQGFANG